MDRSTKDCCADANTVDFLTGEPLAPVGRITLRTGGACDCGNASSTEWTFTRSWDHTLGAPTIEKRYVDPGPAAALEGFPDTPEDHLGRIQRAVGPALAAKYRAGQREHGGVLSQKPGLLAQAEDEAIDQATYLCTLREQLGRAQDALNEYFLYRELGDRGVEFIQRVDDILTAILEKPA